MIVSTSEECNDLLFFPDKTGIEFAFSLVWRIMQTSERVMYFALVQSTLIDRIKNPKT